MYEEYEILSGGWRLPPPESMLSGSEVKDLRTDIVYVAKVKEADLNSAKRAKRRQKIWGEIENNSAWIAFLPIGGIGLAIWSEYQNSETLNIMDVWHKLQWLVIILLSVTVLLFILSAVAKSKEKKFSKHAKNAMRVFHYWAPKDMNEDSLELFPTLKGLAKTPDEIELYKKEQEVEKAVGDQLDALSEKRSKKSSPVSDDEYN